MSIKRSFNVALRFLVLAFVFIALLSMLYFLTKSRIEEQKLKARAEKFLEIEPNLIINSDFFKNPKKIIIKGREGFLYSTNNTIFIESSTNKGYSGEIALLIGLYPDRKTIKGVRVLSHKETAGLGDKIELKKSSWILSFNNESLKTKKFALKKDGGDFDSFAGATITPRAVVNLVNEVLEELAVNN